MQPQDIQNIAAAVEMVIGFGISAVPGNPALLVPEEKILINDLVNEIATLVEARMAVTPPVAAIVAAPTAK